MSSTVADLRLMVVIFRDPPIWPFTRRYYRFCTGTGRSVSTSTDAKINGTYYGGVTVDAGRTEIGVGFDAKPVHPSYRIAIDRDDAHGDLKDIFDDAPDQSFFERREVYVYLVSGDEIPNDDNLQFVGRVPKEGAERSGDKDIVFRLQDRRLEDDQDILRVSIKGNLVGENWKGAFVPVLLGAGYGLETSDRFWVECAVTIARNDGRSPSIRFATPGDYGFGSIEAFFPFEWTNGSGDPKADSILSRELLGSVDLATGRGTVAACEETAWATAAGISTSDRDYETAAQFQEDDHLYIQATPPTQGLRIGSGGLTTEGDVTHPVDVIYHLLTDETYGLGISSADIDRESFRYIKHDILGTWVDQIKCRGRIREQQSVLEVAHQIASEFNMRLTVEADVYRLIWIGWDLNYRFLGSNYDAVIDGGDVVSWEDGGVESSFKVLALRYAYNPRRDRFEGYDTQTVDTGIGAKSNEKATLEAKFIPDDETKAVMIKFLSVSQGGTARRLRVRGTHTVLAAGLRLGDLVYIKNHDDISGVFQVMALAPDFNDFEIDIELYNLTEYATVGHWSPDPGEELPAFLGGGTMPATWADATDAVKSYYGFWTPDNGKNPDASDGSSWG